MAHIIITNFGCFVRDQFKEQQSLEEKEKCAAHKKLMCITKKHIKRKKKNKGEKSNYANGEFRPV